MAEEFNVERFITLKEEYETLRSASDKPSSAYNKIQKIETDLVHCAHYLARQTDNVDAIYWICDKYLYGGCQTGISTDQFESYLKVAIEKDHIPSMCLLARYYYGWGRPMSARQVRKTEALELFERAAAAGNQEGRYNLACALRDSPDQDKRAKAEGLLTALMNESHLGAFYTYYLRFFWDEEGAHHGKEQEGFNVLLRALSCIDTRGLSQEEYYASEIYYYLALCYYEGVGCDEHIDRATSYMQKSAGLREYGDAYFWLKNKGLPISKSAPPSAPNTPHTVSDDTPVIFSSGSNNDDTEIYDYDLDEECPEDLKIKLDKPLGFLPFEQKKEEEPKALTKDDLNDVLAPFDDLVGLDHVKDQIRSLFYMVMANDLRRAKGVKSKIKQSLHMVFTGEPGTGKTMVARLLGKVFKDLNYLRKGHVVEVDRSLMVGQYIGQSEAITRDLFHKARGGVLFIDEAYDLEKGYSPNDYGGEVLSMLVKEMEDNRSNMIVIMAGYPKEMSWMLSSNPGLQSRIGMTLEFPNYKDEELSDIFASYAHEIEFKLAKNTKDKVLSLLQNMEANKKDKFGNARGVRNLFEEALRNQSKRIIEQDITHKTKLITITPDDVPGTFIPKSSGKIIRIK